MEQPLADLKPTRGGFLSPLPDECWLAVLTNLEAAELSGCVSAVCSRLRRLAEQRDLWQALLRSDFCASFSQRAMLLAWLAMHQHFHPRQLYIFKRREHLLDLEVARADLQLRGDQAREQEAKQWRLRVLNYILVRITHLLLSLSLLATSTLLWLRLTGAVQWSFHVVFSPFFIFEAFFLFAALATFVVYCQRSSAGWTFYWNRLQGTPRWFIMYTSLGESIFMLLAASAVAPLAACALEGDPILPWQRFRFLPPFIAFWLAGLCLACSALRRRACSSSCVGSCLLLWVPLAAFSVLLYLRTSLLRHLSPVLLFLPLTVVTLMMLVFASFLTIASFWLGWRGSRDWMEYATTSLLAVLTVLLPLLVMQVSLVGYLKGFVSANWVFVPWTVWLSAILIFTIWQSFTPLRASPTVPIDQLPRHWRNGQGSLSDTELLLPNMGTQV